MGSFKENIGVRSHPFRLMIILRKKLSFQNFKCALVESVFCITPVVWEAAHHLDNCMRQGVPEANGFIKRKRMRTPSVKEEHARE